MEKEKSKIEDKRIKVGDTFYSWKVHQDAYRKACEKISNIDKETLPKEKITTKGTENISADVMIEDYSVPNKLDEEAVHRMMVENYDFDINKTNELAKEIAHKTKANYLNLSTDEIIKVYENVAKKTAEKRLAKESSFKSDEIPNDGTTIDSTKIPDEKQKGPGPASWYGGVDSIPFSLEEKLKQKRRDRGGIKITSGIYGNLTTTDSSFVAPPDFLRSSISQRNPLTVGIPGEKHLLILTSGEGMEMLRLDSNGDIYVKGNLAAIDSQIVDAMRNFLRMMKMHP